MMVHLVRAVSIRCKRNVTIHATIAPQFWGSLVWAISLILAESQAKATIFALCAKTLTPEAVASAGQEHHPTVPDSSPCQVSLRSARPLNKKLRSGTVGNQSIPLTFLPDRFILDPLRSSYSLRGEIPGCRTHAEVRSGDTVFLASKPHGNTF